jgi:hypothetical protein
VHPAGAFVHAVTLGIPRFDSRTHSYAKWIIFALSSIPMFAAIALLIVRMTMAFRARSQQLQQPQPF